MPDQPKLKTAEQWRSAFIQDKDANLKDYFKQVQLDCLRWAAEIVADGAILEAKPAYWGFLTQRRDAILEKMKEL